MFRKRLAGLFTEFCDHHELLFLDDINSPLIFVALNVSVIGKTAFKMSFLYYENYFLFPYINLSYKYIMGYRWVYDVWLLLLCKYMFLFYRIYCMCLIYVPVALIAHSWSLIWRRFINFIHAYILSLCLFWFS